MSKVVLSLKEIVKTYRSGKDQIKVLNKISLDVNEGDFIALHGKSGCGKTTGLLIAGGLLEPDEGHVILNDTDVYALGHEERSHLRSNSMGFVFQQFHLIPYLSALDNILLPTLALPSKTASTRALELATELNLTERLHHLPSRLSTGERQRVALARALLNKPKIILADEPTGNLDEENGEIVLSILQKFAQSDGAVLMVTHTADVARYTTKQFHLGKGTISPLMDSVR